MAFVGTPRAFVGTLMALGPFRDFVSTSKASIRISKTPAGFYSVAEQKKRSQLI